jgi:hypothetical protein
MLYSLGAEQLTVTWSTTVHLRNCALSLVISLSKLVPLIVSEAVS